ncbi:MAG: ribosome recycling factor [Lachnospiraceae bacterium]|nr:ribosome recycling factor [Lachnospiraceae bacterium]
MASERIAEYEERMNKTIEYLKTELQAVRAGRANPHVLDKVKVDYYGTPTPIQQLANVAVPEARVLQISPWDKKSLKDIEKAILASDVGITPTNDGSVIRLNFPEMTEERRTELSKDIQKKGESVKVTIRNARRDGNDAFKKLRKNSELSEDDEKDLQEELQKMTDKFIKQVDDMVEEKKKEIMTV